MGSVGRLLSSLGVKLSFASTGCELLATFEGNMGLQTSTVPGQHRGEYVLPRPPEDEL